LGISNIEQVTSNIEVSKNYKGSHWVYGNEEKLVTAFLNIVINAILSVPTPIQQFAFDQPNIAILYFPFTWLPCFIVPAVLLSHIVSIKKLTTI